MKKFALLAPLMALALVACESHETTTVEPTATVTADAGSGGTQAEPTNTAVEDK